MARVFVAGAVLTAVLSLAAPASAASAESASAASATTVTNGLIAYSQFDAGYPQIFTMTADGQGRVQLTSGASIAVSPSWSPNGTRLAYATNKRFLEGFDIFTMTADGAHQAPLALSDDAASPSWSHNGHEIAYSDRRSSAGLSQLYITNSDQSGTIAVPHTVKTNANFSPSWAPNGVSLVYVSQPQPQAGVFGNELLKELDLATGKSRTLYSAPYIEHPSWSPDGKTIAFTALSPGSTTPVQSDIYLLDVATKHVTQLTTTAADTAHQDASWSPDGTKILFDTTTQNQPGPGSYSSELQTLTIAGATVQTLLGPIADTAFTSSWQPVVHRRSAG